MKTFLILARTVIKIIVNKSKTMRKILVIFMTITFISCAPRINNGKYCHKVIGGGGPCIELIENNNFKWVTYTDFGPPTVGQGKYMMKDKKLHLKFNKDSISYNSTMQVINSEKTNEDEISLEIKVVDKQKQSSPNALVSLINSDKSYYSGVNGIVKIHNITKSEKALKIKIEPRELLESYSFDFVPNNNVKLLITLHEAKPSIISDTIYVYEILEKNSKKMILKNSVGQTQKFISVEK